MYIIMIQDESLIPGIGNEVLLVLGGFFACLIGLLGWMYMHRKRNEANSPEVDIARDARILEELRQEYRQAMEADNNGDDNEPRPAPAAPAANGDASPQCPICLEELRHACETSCGHSFCGECLLSYWRRGGENHPIRCPQDRTEVRFLISSYTLRGQCRPPRMGVDAATVDRDIEQYNIRFESVSRRWASQNIGAFGRLPHEFGSLLLHQKLIVIVMLCTIVLYLLLPFDLVPEAVFGIFGLIDDFLGMIIMIIMIGYYVRMIQLSFRLMNRPAAG